MSTTIDDNDENKLIIMMKNQKENVLKYLTENELTIIHKALTLIRKTCKNVKNIIYKINDKIRKIILWLFFWYNFFQCNLVMT